MKLYALRDNLLAYFLAPFVAPNDNAVKAALSQSITAGGDNNAIAQAPHQFTVWEIAEIDEETLQLAPIHRILCDCSSLIRARPGKTESGASTGTNGTGGYPAVPRGPESAPSASDGAREGQTQAEASQADQIRERPSRTHRLP